MSDIVSRITCSYTTADGKSGVNGRIEDVGTGTVRINKVLSAGTNSPIGVGFVGTAVKSYAILASADCTIKVNSTTSPTATLNLKAGYPLIYSEALGYYSNAFATSGSVTTFYVTSSNTVRVQFTGVVG